MHPMGRREPYKKHRMVARTFHTAAVAALLLSAGCVVSSESSNYRYDGPNPGLMICDSSGNTAPLVTFSASASGQMASDLVTLPGLEWLAKYQPSNMAWPHTADSAKAEAMYTAAWTKDGLSSLSLALKAVHDLDNNHVWCISIDTCEGKAQFGLIAAAASSSCFLGSEFQVVPQNGHPF